MSDHTTTTYSQTNASIRMRALRAERKQQMGEEEFKKQQALEKQQYRARVRATAGTVPRVNAVDTTENAIEQIINQRAQALSRYNELKGTMSEEEMEAKREYNRLQSRLRRIKEKLSSHQQVQTNTVSVPKQSSTKRIVDYSDDEDDTISYSDEGDVSQQAPEHVATTNQSSRRTLEIDDLPALLASVSKRKSDDAKTDITIKNYVSKLNSVSNAVLGHPFDGDASFLVEDPRVVINALKNYVSPKTKQLLSPLSLKDYFASIVVVLQALHVDPAIIKQYQTVMQEGIKHVEQERGENRMSEKEKEIYLPLKTVMKDLDAYTYTKAGQKGAYDTEKLVNYVIGCLYFRNKELIARNDYAEMKLVNIKKPLKDLNDKFNYLRYNPQTNSVVQFVMLNYKTKAKYHRQEFDISPDLRKVLNAYIAVTNKQAGDFLFTTSTGKQYQNSNFGKRIQQAMHEITGKAFGVDMIRQIHIRAFMESKHTKNERRDFAKKFLHSEDIQSEYDKFK